MWEFIYFAFFGPADIGYDYGFFGAITAAVIAIGGSIADKRAAKRAAKRAQRTGLGFASSENFERLVAELQPRFKELIASGLGPQFQQRVATNTARRGLTGTGIGLSLKNAADAFPSTAAFQAALREAGRIQGGQVGFLAGQAPFPSGGFSDALGSGASAFAAFQGLGGAGGSGRGSGNPFQQGVPGGLPLGGDFFGV